MRSGVMPMSVMVWILFSLLTLKEKVWVSVWAPKVTETYTV
jgi:hypothetical protein